MSPRRCKSGLVTAPLRSTLTRKAPPIPPAPPPSFFDRNSSATTQRHRVRHRSRLISLSPSPACDSGECDSLPWIGSNVGGGSMPW
ncbi:hypothetical protein JCGZ_08904 [Jatropha curcas]|uniref:Uncharacterized protein n=1 Tax=Jatropha curcas TaxID=180498 RepID=A0A067KJU9_JATCU|nr:hypothetical protein JCGZ_08904 [Jatropha curcas]